MDDTGNTCNTFVQNMLHRSPKKNLRKYKSWKSSRVWGLPESQSTGTLDTRSRKMTSQVQGWSWHWAAGNRRQVWSVQLVLQLLGPLPLQIVPENYHYKNTFVKQIYRADRLSFFFKNHFMHFTLYLDIMHTES